MPLRNLSRWLVTPTAATNAVAIGQSVEPGVRRPFAGRANGRRRSDPGSPGGRSLTPSRT